MKYHFLKGSAKGAETLEFKDDNAAAAAAKKNPDVLRVQHSGHFGYVYEKNVGEAEESPKPEPSKAK